MTLRDKVTWALLNLLLAGVFIWSIHPPWALTPTISVLMVIIYIVLQGLMLMEIPGREEDEFEDDDVDDDLVLIESTLDSLQSWLAHFQDKDPDSEYMKTLAADIRDYKALLRGD